MIRTLYFAGGIASLLLGAIGVLLPVLPTVPFIILAAFCFARSNARWEKWLVDHRHFGPHIVAWRDRGAISRRGKVAATIAFAISATVGLLVLEPPWSLVPLGAALIGGGWMMTRPDS